MTLIQDLGFGSLSESELRDWAISLPTNWASGLVQTGKHVVTPVPLTDGSYISNANILTEETGYLADALSALPVGSVKAVSLKACKGLVPPHELPDEAEAWPQWEQIAGAGLGPQGAEDGWPVGAHVWKDGEAWTSRVQNNVNEPLMGASSTWSRDDGTFVTPSSWEYQIGEEVTEDDGATWFRVIQKTSFAPSASPSQYVEITGPGGEPVPQTDEWAAGVSYTAGPDPDVVIYQGTSYTCLQSHTSQVGWEPPNVPALWSEA